MILFYFLGILALIVLRLGFAYYFPAANVEAYYWDWGRAPQLSYFDHPPMVGWMAWLGEQTIGGLPGARVMMLFCHGLGLAFLGLSLKYFWPGHVQKRDDSSAPTEQKSSPDFHAYFALFLLGQILPVFAVQSFVLMPDPPLLLGLGGALYFALRSRAHLSTTNALGLGFFLGFAFLSKYHAAPVAVGLALVLWAGATGFSLRLKTLRFFAMTVGTALLVASPVFLWNAMNNWASFAFQLNHGYSDGGFQLKNVLGFLGETALYLTPWVFVYVFYYAAKDMLRGPKSGAPWIVFVPFAFIFLLFFSSSFQNFAHPYWAIPGFWLLLPWLATKITPLSLWWRRGFVFCAVVGFLVPALLTFNGIRSMITWTSSGAIGHQIFLWDELTWERVQKEAPAYAGLKFISQSEATSPQTSCVANRQVLLGSLDWTWTAQLALRWDEAHAVNIRYEDRSFYDSRDEHLKNFRGCQVFFVARESWFLENQPLNKRVRFLNHTKIVLKEFPKRPVVVGLAEIL